MPVQIVVEEGQDIETVLHLFQRLLDRKNGRPWYKRRYGYYEKPSLLRRKRRKMASLRGGKGRGAVYPRPRHQPTTRVYPPTYIRISDKELWARSGPTMSAGRQIQQKPKLPRKRYKQVFL